MRVYAYEDMDIQNTDCMGVRTCSLKTEYRTSNSRVLM